MGNVHPSLCGHVGVLCIFKSCLIETVSYMNSTTCLLTSLPQASLRRFLILPAPCVIFPVNSSHASGAVAVHFHACQRSAACRSDERFTSFGPIFRSLFSAQIPHECCLRGTSSHLRRWKMGLWLSAGCCFPPPGCPHFAKSCH